MYWYLSCVFRGISCIHMCMFAYCLHYVCLHMYRELHAWLLLCFCYVRLFINSVCVANKLFMGCRLLPGPDFSNKIKSFKFLFWFNSLSENFRLKLYIFESPAQYLFVRSLCLTVPLSCLCRESDMCSAYCSKKFYKYILSFYCGGLSCRYADQTLYTFLCCFRK